MWSSLCNLFIWWLRNHESLTPTFKWWRKQTNNKAKVGCETLTHIIMKTIKSIINLENWYLFCQQWLNPNKLCEHGRRGYPDATTEEERLNTFLRLRLAHTARSLQRNNTQSFLTAELWQKMLTQIYLHHTVKRSHAWCLRSVIEDLPLKTTWAFSLPPGGGTNLRLHPAF